MKLLAWQAGATSMSPLRCLHEAHCYISTTSPSVLRVVAVKRKHCGERPYYKGMHENGAMEFEAPNFQSAGGGTPPLCGFPVHFQ